MWRGVWLILAVGLVATTTSCAPTDISLSGQQEEKRVQRSTAAPTPERGTLDPITAPAKPELRDTGPMRTVLLEDVPHVRQKPDFCGEACAAMWLTSLGIDTDQDSVFDASELDPALGRGAWTRDLKKALEIIGFRVGPVWYAARADHADEDILAVWRDVHADLLDGIPSIVCTHFDDSPNTTEHFRLVVGYDADSDEVIYHDPALDDGGYLRMERADFFALWPLKYDPETWTLVRLRLDAGEGELEVAKPASGLTSADYAQRVIELGEEAPHGFHIVVEPPFVVIGDETREMVERRAEHTVRWAVEKLRADFFDSDPDRIIDIWLFADATSYEGHVPVLFGEIPSTPYGYYSEEHDALIMNIGTGGGTLVHEIVHPYIEANFPDCPAWFNEGLASLYEQCAEVDGHIVGRTNWRLEGLQEAIGDEILPSFSDLMHTSTNEFYNDPLGTNYGQARYLCYDLQEKGLLVDFYRKFSENVAQDPSGYASLKSVLGENDMKAFQQDWEARTMSLSYP